MKLPLSRFAPSPSLAAREGDDTLGAGRPFLGVPGVGLRRLHAPLTQPNQGMTDL